MVVVYIIVIVSKLLFQLQCKPKRLNKVYLHKYGFYYESITYLLPCYHNIVQIINLL